MALASGSFRLEGERVDRSMIRSFPTLTSLEKSLMQSETREPWFQLCHLAAVEQDPAKVLVLVTEIDRLLEEWKARAKRNFRPSH